MSDYKNFSNSPTKISGLSPDKYGKNAFKDLSYTPEKLFENFMFKQVTISKKIEQQKKRIRQLQAQNTMYIQKIRKLETENQTVKKSLNLQIQMYKKMLKDQQEDKNRHIKNMQESFNLEIQKLLQSHEQDSKIAQAQKEQIEAQVRDLLLKIRELQDLLANSNHNSSDLSKKLEITTQRLANTQQKLQKSQQLASINNERANNQINALNQRIEKERQNFKQQFESAVVDKNREIEGIRKLHQSELQKMENRRNVEMATKNLQLKQLKITFQTQTKRLEDIINQKDRTNSILNLDLNKEKQKVLGLTKHYDAELNQLLNKKEHLEKQIELGDKKLNAMQLQYTDLKISLSNERNHSDNVIQGLRTDLTKANLGLIKQNQNLGRTIQKYQHQLNYLREENRLLEHEKHVDITKYRVSADQLYKQNRELVSEIKSLKEILLESSLQMQKCKQQFIRLQHEKQRLIRISRDCEQQSSHFKMLLNEKQLEIRQWRDSYFGLKNRY